MSDTRSAKAPPSPPAWNGIKSVWVACEVCETEFWEHPAALPPHLCDVCELEWPHRGDDDA